MKKWDKGLDSMKKRLATIKKRTVRELGGDIWAELEQERRRAGVQGASVVSTLPWELVVPLTDFIMAVLARHIGELIIQDGELEVLPLPQRLDSP